MAVPCAAEARGGELGVGSYLSWPPNPALNQSPAPLRPAGETCRQQDPAACWDAWIVFEGILDAAQGAGAAPVTVQPKNHALLVAHGLVPGWWYDLQRSAAIKSSAA